MKINKKHIRALILEVVESNYKVFDSSDELQQLPQRKRALQKQKLYLEEDLIRMRMYDSPDRSFYGTYYDEEEFNDVHSQIKKIEAEIAKIDDILSTEHIT